ncbi:hypothetical protein BJ322DRAFT_1084836 [Thelephora terrestris]|uniref:F-box domain-containing protein n=1 Tax=Thelephora terrestris TaxID=56493 RepID=A0A9P6H6A8_9AGAM|nr:hypothetical protein BJ322DRAFT_1084836 [Thelephora terrestris]
MDTHAYPGQGLSLSQLVFALNEELKRVAYRSSFSFDMLSQLDRDTSTALADIREWRNTLVPINRFPLEVLSIIPTHLSGEDNLVNVSSVCRHWRRTFVQHAILWTNLNLTLVRTNLYIKTRLERAKGSALNITLTHLGRDHILALLSPHVQQLGCLHFIFDCWSYVRGFSEFTSGPLPLLHTLKIHVAEDDDILHPQPMINPSLPLFGGAINLKNFALHTEVLPFLDHFNFPSLTTFELSAISEDQVFPTAQLLDFLEATPTLRDVRIAIHEEISLAGVPQGRIVVLPAAETLYVSQADPSYVIAAHISCPAVKAVSLVQEQDPAFAEPQEAFPTSATWNIIPPRYMANQIDEIQLESIAAQNLSCSISFLSPDPDSTTLELGYRIVEPDDDDGVIRRLLGAEYVQVLYQASRTIQNHPLSLEQLTLVAHEIGQLFKAMGPLEELALGTSDLQPFLAPFIDLPNFHDLRQWFAYPQIKGLSIADRRQSLATIPQDAIVEFAMSQHALGVPFEWVAFCLKDPPIDMAERLQPWVGAVHFLPGGLVVGEEEPVVDI